MAESIQLGADEDTQDSLCPVCAARATVDARAIRAGLVRATFVQSMHRHRPGAEPIEEWSAYVCLDGDVIGRGKGHSREEALFEALRDAGVRS